MALDSIFSIIPTIGNVVGGLLEGLFTEGKDAPLKKYTFRVGTSVSDEIDIVNENGQLSLRNRTPNPLCVSFPAQNGNEGEVVMVQSCNVLPLNDRFKACAANDVDTFNITSVTGESVSKKALFAGENVLTISAGGTVKVNEKEPKFIGVYTSVVLTEKNITIRQIDGNGKGEIVNLYMQAASGSGTFQTHEVALSTDNSVTIPHTLILTPDSEVHVSVTLNYATGNYAEYMKKNDQKYGIRRMSNEEIKMLESVVAVNHTSK